LSKTVRKEVSSFTVDPQILRELERAVPRQRKSETIENLIIEYLKAKSPERVSIISQAKQNDPETNQGDSNNV
jgi:hypothetical protein